MNVKALVSRLQSFGDAFPSFPIYCTELFTGEFYYVSRAFASLVAWKREIMLDKDKGLFLAKNLYKTSAERAEWIKLLQQARPTDVFTFRTQILLGDSMESESGRVAKHVLDICSPVELDEPKNENQTFIVGMLFDNESATIDRLVNEEKLNAYREVMNKIDSGFHEIDEQGNIIFMNDALKKRLNASEHDFRKNPIHVCKLSPLESEHKAKKIRVKDKIYNGDDLTKDEHREFACPVLDVRKEERPLEEHPVNISDFVIKEPDLSKVRRNRGIFTLSLDERVPLDIVAKLKELGPKSPVLEALNEPSVGTFVKVTPQDAFTILGNESKIERHGRDLVFIYMNRRVIEEFSQAVPENTTSFIGKTDSVLWPEFASQYAKADRTIIESREIDHRIEKHMIGNDEVQVQVLKLRVYRGGNDKSISLTPINDEAPIGVAGFYWKIDKGSNISAVQDKLRSGLGQIHSHSTILDNLSHAVYIKNLDRRYIYANEKYLDELRLRTDVDTRLDLIGKNDSEVFCCDRIVEEIAKDENQVTDVPVSIKTIRNGREVDLTITPVFNPGSDQLQYIQYELSANEPPRLIWMDEVDADGTTRPRLNVLRDTYEFKNDNQQGVKVWRLLLANLNALVPMKTISNHIGTNARKNQLKANLKKNYKSTCFDQYYEFRDGPSAIGLFEKDKK